MHSATASSLIASLSTERSALVSFVALLEREQSLLQEGQQTEQLLELSEQKSNDAINLSRLTESRLNWLRKIIAQPDNGAIQDWLITHSPNALPIWQDIVTLAQRAKQLNHINGELIQMKLRHNQQALTVLNNAANKAGAYDRNGKPEFSPSSGRSLGRG